jgi:hypothetical protein
VGFCLQSPHPVAVRRTRECLTELGVRRARSLVMRFLNAL